MKFRFIALLAMVIGLAFLRTAAATGTLMTWTVDGLKREALVFTPTSAKKEEKHPVVFGFHGHGGNMRLAARGMHLQDLWPEAIVVYPQGVSTPSMVDPLGKRPGWQRQAGDDGDRDLKFVDAMLATLKEKYSADEKRVYSLGFSNGAIFSYLLWAKREKYFAGFGICAGKIPYASLLTQPKPAIIFAGEKDEILPFDAQKKSIDAVLKIDGVTAPGQSCGQLCTSYGASSPPIVMTIIHPGGHVFPPGAAKAIVDFLKSHS